MKAVIHRALHSGRLTVSINDITYNIKTLSNGCRSVIVKQGKSTFEYVTQNPNTKSDFAQRAKKGERLTWRIPIIAGLRGSGKWVLITDKDEDLPVKITL